MRALIAAIQFLTRLPMPRMAISDEDFVRSIRWFPAVGLIIGAIVAAGSWAGAKVDQWIGTLIALLLWVGVTGALHLDGLGDIADAAGAAHKDRDRLTAVLADPHVGSFAVVAIGLQLACKLVLLRLTIGAHDWLAIVCIPAVARIGPLWWTQCLPSLHAGLGARFRSVPMGLGIAVWAALLCVAIWWVPALAIAPLLFLLWAWWIVRRIGGISGDGHGAGIELIESGLLFAALLFARL